MVKKLIDIYKVPLLISFTLAIVLISLKLERNPAILAMIFCGTLLGTFGLDADYLLYTYFIEPTSDFSKTLAGFIKHKDISNALVYMYHHKNEIKDKTLNNALFQAILLGSSLLVISSNSSYLIKALILSMFANSIYKLVEYFLKDQTAEWFWMLKSKPSKTSVKLYIVGLLVTLLFCIKLF